MECDIHLHIEIKLNGTWHHYAAPDIQRWYKLFEKMAGVRGELKDAISPPKGMPEDITEVTRYSNFKLQPYAHSHSWLGLDEIVELEDWLNEQIEITSNYTDLNLEFGILHTYLFGNSFAGFKRYPEDYENSGIQDVRFVFWFDN